MAKKTVILDEDEAALIAEHRKKKAEKVAEWAPPEASDITVAEKCKAFDKLHKMTLEHTLRIIRDRDYGDDDDVKHFIYEAAMEGTLGENVFDHLNKVTKGSWS